ncbi:MAG: hypothetical protein AAFX46_17830 [Cyanobacteria bacterium J06636_27]
MNDKRTFPNVISIVHAAFTLHPFFVLRLFVNNLHSREMSLPQFYSLAATVKASAFFADCPLSKTAIAHTLSTSRPSIKRLESIAFSHISEFRQDYPEYPKEEWLMRKSKYNREVLLTPFQTWIVSLLKKCMEHLGKKTAVESFILANAYLFTRETFRKELQKLAQLSA